MPFTINKLGDVPAVVLTPSDKNMLQEKHDMEQRTLDVFNTLSEPAYLIIDIRNVRLGLDDVTLSANQTARDRPDVINHPNLRELLVVTKDGLLKLAIQGMSSPIFGSMRIRVFDTPEAALDYCREQIAAASPDQARKESG